MKSKANIPIFKGSKKHLKSLLGEKFLPTYCFFAKSTLRSHFPAFCCVIHGFLPFLFTSTGSKKIDLLHKNIAERKKHFKVKTEEDI